MPIKSAPWNLQIESDRTMRTYELGIGKMTNLATLGVLRTILEW